MKKKIFSDNILKSIEDLKAIEERLKKTIQNMSRTCVNCKYHIVNANETQIWCTKENNITEDKEVTKDFGFNDFKER